jgi:hypothetical protein
MLGPTSDQIGLHETSQGYQTTSSLHNINHEGIREGYHNPLLLHGKDNRYHFCPLLKKGSTGINLDTVSTSAHFFQTTKNQ